MFDSLFTAKRAEPALNEDGEVMPGVVDFYECRLWKTLDESDPALQENKKIFRIRFSPNIMLLQIFPRERDNYRRCRLFKATCYPTFEKVNLAP